MLPGSGSSRPIPKLTRRLAILGDGEGQVKSPDRRGGDAAGLGGHRGSRPQQMVTVPAVPSTVMIAPSSMRLVASGTETTQGIPSSRDTIMA